MDAEWQQQIGNVHDDLDLTIPSDDKDSFWNNLAIVDDDNVDNVEDPTDEDYADEDYTGSSSSRNKRRGRASKRTKRHSREQIQQLEALFLECSHPDEKVRLDIANKIGMGVMQVKVWFQNRRSAKKNQLKREDNKMLRQQNESLKANHQALKAALLNKTCPTCGGLMLPREKTLEMENLLLENARLKDELFHLTDYLKGVSGKAPMPMPGGYGQLAANLDINGSTSNL
ncbi:hypothetical protein ACQ4PT_015532 [Festuca glaucescens]